MQVPFYTVSRGHPCSAADGTCYGPDTSSDFTRKSRGWGCDQRANLHSACAVRFGARPHLITGVQYRLLLSTVTEDGEVTEFVTRASSCLSSFICFSPFCYFAFFLLSAFFLSLYIALYIPHLLYIPILVYFPPSLSPFLFQFSLSLVLICLGFLLSLLLSVSFFYFFCLHFSFISPFFVVRLFFPLSPFLSLQFFVFL